QVPGPAGPRPRRDGRRTGGAGRHVGAHRPAARPGDGGPRPGGAGYGGGTVTAAPSTAPPTAAQVLHRCRDLVRPELERAVARLHPWVGEMAAYSFGWCEVGGAPATAPGGKGVRQALAVLGAEAVGGPARAGTTAAVA